MPEPAIIINDRGQAHAVIAAALMVDQAEAHERGLTWDAHAAATAVLDTIAQQVETATTVTTSDLRPDALLPEDRANFDTLKQAMENDDVALLHARHIASGEHHALLCVMSDPQDGSGDTYVVPVARLIDGDPTEQYANPADVLTGELSDRATALFDSLDPHTAANVEPHVRAEAADLPREQQDALIRMIRFLDPALAEED